MDDIWQEGSDPRECEDCGHTSRSCTCFEMECQQCEKIVESTDAKEWNGNYFCDEDCLQMFINE